MWGVGQKGEGLRVTHTALWHACVCTRTDAWLRVSLTYTLKAFLSCNKIQKPPTGEKSAAAVALLHEAQRTNLQASTFYFFFLGLLPVFFFFLKPAEISCTSIKYPFLRLPLEAKRERKRRRTTLRKSLLAAERGGGGDKSLLFFALPSSPATAACFFFIYKSLFHT